MAIQYGRISFKGATDPSLLCSVVRELLLGSATEEARVVLHLLVTQTRLGKAFIVRKWCLLETQMEQFEWAKRRDRIEEICNTALFGVRDWNGMLRDLGMDAWDPSPVGATVAVTRRGVMTMRVTWDETGVPWTDNALLLDAGDRLARLLRGLA